MNQLMRRCAIALATCLILTCGVLAYAEVIPQSIQDEEQVGTVMDIQDEEPVIDDVTEDEEYTETEIVFTDDDMMILPRPVQEGKIFIEWNTREDGTGIGFKAGEIVSPENLELYTIWADAEILVDEATVSEATAVEAEYDSELQEDIIEKDDAELQEEIIGTDVTDLQEEITEMDDEVLQEELLETDDEELQKEITEADDEELQNGEIE